MNIFQNPLIKAREEWRGMDSYARIFAVCCFAVFAFFTGLIISADAGRIVTYQNQDVMAERMLLDHDVILSAAMPSVRVKIHFDEKSGFVRTTYGPWNKFGGTREFNSSASAEEIRIYKEVNYGQWSDQLCLRDTSTSATPIPQSLS